MRSTITLWISAIVTINLLVIEVQAEESRYQEAKWTYCVASKLINEFCHENEPSAFAKWRHQNCNSPKTTEAMSQPLIKGRREIGTGPNACVRAKKMVRYVHSWGPPLKPPSLERDAKLPRFCMLLASKVVNDICEINRTFRIDDWSKKHCQEYLPASGGYSIGFTIGSGQKGSKNACATHKEELAELWMNFVTSFDPSPLQ